jgi:hypothetical protein
MQRNKKELGGGPNSFRGGRNSKLYSVKTRVGNWLEDWSDCGFTAAGYISMAQAQMYEGEAALQC